jgi:hypothetical protein
MDRFGWAFWLEVAVLLLAAWALFGRRLWRRAMQPPPAFPPPSRTVSHDPGRSPRLDPGWSAYWVYRALTDEPGKGMGAPFSQAQAHLFLRACGLEAGGGSLAAEDQALVERMWQWLETQRT